MIKLFIAILLLPVSAFATPLVADLSTNRISMDSGFTGTRLFVFGARNDVGDVVTVIRGPEKDFVLRKKESFAGLWLNWGRMKILNAPSFYAIAASKPLSEINQDALFKQLAIGERTVLTQPENPAKMAAFNEFSDAFLDYQHREQRYTETPSPIRFIGEMLFKTAVDFPDTIPTGRYTAEIYLINDGKVIGLQTMPITVVKTGIDAWLYDTAHDHPAWYGLAAVFLAISVGWLASRIFEKV